MLTMQIDSFKLLARAVTEITEQRLHRSNGQRSTNRAIRLE
jgi:hypothetical protein